MRTFGRFWYDFVVGDDWVIAVGVVILLTIVSVLADSGFVAWVTAGVGVSALLIVSVWRAASPHEVLLLRCVRRPGVAEAVGTVTHPDQDPLTTQGGQHRVGVATLERLSAQEDAGLGGDDAKWALVHAGRIAATDRDDCGRGSTCGSLRPERCLWKRGERRT